MSSDDKGKKRKKQSGFASGIDGLMKRIGKGARVILCPLVFCLVAATSQGAIVRVGADKTYSAIRQAVDNSRDGDTIEVYPGIYREKLSVDREITIRGIGHPVIDGGFDGHVVIISAPNVIFEGFKIQNGGENLANDDSGIFIESTAENGIIRNNRIERCSFGIWVNGANNIKIVNNHVVGRRDLISQKRGNGIHVWNVLNGLVEGNEIEGARDGILISVTKKSLIKDNRIWDLRYGVHYMYADSNRLEGNVTFDTRAGLAIMFSKKLEIDSNYSYDNKEYGILFRDLMHSKVINNVMANNEKGLFLYNSLFNEIRGNIVAENDIGTHVWAGSEDNVVADNSFIRNKSQVKYVGMKDEDWSDHGTGNFWSDYLGWDLDGDGIGDTPYEANTLMERLVWAYPMIKLLLNSPAVQTMRMFENQFPVVRSPGIVDSAPRMRPLHENWRKWIERSNN